MNFVRYKKCYCDFVETSVYFSETHTEVRYCNFWGKRRGSRCSKIASERSRRWPVPSLSWTSRPGWHLLSEVQPQHRFFFPVPSWDMSVHLHHVANPTWLKDPHTGSVLDSGLWHWGLDHQLKMHDLNISLELVMPHQLCWTLSRYKRRGYWELGMDS